MALCKLRLLCHAELQYDLGVAFRFLRASLLLIHLHSAKSAFLQNPLLLISEFLVKGQLCELEHTFIFRCSPLVFLFLWNPQTHSWLVWLPILYRVEVTIAHLLCKFYSNHLLHIEYTLGLLNF